MKVVNKKLFVVSIILLVLSVVAWAYLLQPLVIYEGEDGEIFNYISWLSSEYFMPYLAAGTASGVSMMALFGTIFAAFCTIRGIGGILKACGIIKMKTLKGLFAFFGFLLGLIMLGVAFSNCGMNTLIFLDEGDEYFTNMIFELVMLLNVFIMCIVAKILESGIKKEVKRAKEESKFQKAVAEAVAEKEASAE